jgi:type VI secretion system protein ImpI
MGLVLKIENETSLPDGGPLSFAVQGTRGFDVGRDRYLDWVLPDPNRVVSGKHCEVRYRDGAYWLNDVSTNGTFVNGSEKRISGPYRLRHGDRIEIGKYIISVTLDSVGDDAGNAAAPAKWTSPGGVWDVGSDAAAPPAPIKDFRPVRQGAPSLDATPLDWAMEIATPPAQPKASSTAWDVPKVDGGFGETDRAVPVPAPRRAELPPLPTATDPWALPPVKAPPTAPKAAAGAEEPEREAPRAPSKAPASDAALADDFANKATPATTPAPETAAQESTRSQPRLPPASTDAAEAFITRFARGAGIERSQIATKDAGALAEQLGVLVRITTDNVRQLLAARAQAKGLMRSASQTMIQMQDNNPMRFSPNSEDALGIMFGQRTKSYLDPAATLDHSFADLKEHQLVTFTAMQQALVQLLGDLDPAAIEAANAPKKGLAGVLASKKTDLWDTYVTRWKMKAGAKGESLLDTYMRYFSDAYDKNT